MKTKNVKDLLSEKFTPEEMKQLVTSFDIIGSIAILEVPEQLRSREKEIAEAIMAVNKPVKTVCRRAGEHSGVFRIRPVEVIAGENTTETLYVESGARMLVDVNHVYFTPRLSFERERIAAQVKEGEVIGAWFAGVGPFPLVIFKKQKKVKIHSIELNPVAYEYMVKNIKLNKAGEAIIPHLGDVREIAKTLEKCDRITMPLPLGAETFLDAAFDSVKSGGTIHYYTFGEMSDPFSDAEAKVFLIASKCGKKVMIANKRIVRPFSPSRVQVVFDIVALD